MIIPQGITKVSQSNPYTSVEGPGYVIRGYEVIFGVNNNLVDLETCWKLWVMGYEKYGLREVQLYELFNCASVARG